MNDSNTNKIELRVAEHKYLADQYRHHNWLIHTTLYLNIIFIAGAIQFITVNPDGEHGLAAAFAFFVFLGLGAYTVFHISARERIKSKMMEIDGSLGFEKWKKESGKPKTLKDLIKAGGLLFFFYFLPLLLSGISFVVY